MNSAIVSAVLNRLKEPSTYAGLSPLFALLGVSTAQANGYIAAAAGVASVAAALLAVIMPEQAK
jgi:hypothetical protein